MIAMTRRGRSVFFSVVLWPLFSDCLGQQPRVNPAAQLVPEFNKRVNEYLTLHKKLESTLPALPKDATPQQMDVHERALGKLVQENRTGAKPGDLFTAEMQAFVRRLLGDVFRGPDGRQIK